MRAAGRPKPPSKASTSLSNGGSIGWRPELPGSTPAPGVAGTRSPYSNGATFVPDPKFSQSGPARLTEDSGRFNQPETFELINAAGDDKRAVKRQQDAMLSKMVSRLPHNVREPVSSILQMAFDTSANAQAKLDSQAIEVINLRGEMKKKTVHIEKMDKTCDIYRNRLKILEEKLRSLNDEIDSRQQLTTQNKRAMMRMSSTSRMLINSLEALNVEQPGGGGGGGDKLSSDMDRQKSNAQGVGKATTYLATSPQRDSPSVDLSIMLSVPGFDTKPLGANAANEKLRESLLRVAREHYRYVKKTENLEETVRGLRDSLSKA